VRNGRGETCEIQNENKVGNGAILTGVPPSLLVLGIRIRLASYCYCGHYRYQLLFLVLPVVTVLSLVTVIATVQY
jgi:hypothetical protein